MSGTQQSAFTIMTLAEWMNQHDDRLEEVVLALCQIYDLPHEDIVRSYVEDEIDRQARLLLIVDDQRTILAIAGWNWAHADDHSDELPVYLGIRTNVELPGVRLLLIESVVKRLRKERIHSDHTSITTALLQFRPDDRDLRSICDDLGYARDKRRNETFQASLGARGYLRSMVAPINDEL